MLLLLFQLEENLYAIDTDKIIKIMPMVQLRKMTTAPNYLAGILNYGGQIVPVLDLCHLLNGEPCQIRYSTRLILMENPMVKDQNKVKIGTGETDSGEVVQSHLALVAERVTETIKVSANELNNTQQISNFPFMGEFLIDEKGIIQLIHWQELVKQIMNGITNKTLSQTLLPGGGDRTNGAGRS